MITNLASRGPIHVLCLFLSLLGCSGSNRGGPTPTPPQLPPPSPPPTCDGTGFVDRTTFPIVTEVEPNNDISTAFGVTIPTPMDRQSVGLSVNGTVHDSADPIDTIAFTSTRSIKFFIKLCEDTCNSISGNDKDGNPDSLDTSIAYFDVLDAAGMVIGSTSTNIATENYTELCIEGGVITYIQVIAYNTLTSAQAYKMTAMEAR